MGGTDKLEKPLSLHGTEFFVVALVWGVVVVVVVAIAVFVFETGSSVSQAGFELTKQPRMALNF